MDDEDLLLCRRVRSWYAHEQECERDDALAAPPPGEVGPDDDLTCAARPTKQWHELLDVDHLIILDADVLGEIRRHVDGSTTNLVGRALLALRDHRGTDPEHVEDDERFCRYERRRHVWIADGHWEGEIVLDADVVDEIWRRTDGPAVALVGVAALVREGLALLLAQLVAAEAAYVPGSSAPPLARRWQPPVVAEPISHADFRAAFRAFL